MELQVKRTLRIALAGNPNAGKTTLFNALTGSHHVVGNYPGVTVEKREGDLIRNGKQYHFVDLPGIYSLTAYSIDEVVTRDFLLDEKPDAIVDVLDSSNLERNLYLCLQFQELGIPVVGALNMTDEASAKGINIDENHLSALLGIPLVKSVASKEEGIDQLFEYLDNIADGDLRSSKYVTYTNEIESKLLPIQQLIESDESFIKKYPVRWLAIKLLEKDPNAYERIKTHKKAAEIEAAAKDAVSSIEQQFSKDAEIIISEERYQYIGSAVKESVKLAKKKNVSITEKIDKVMMNRFLAFPIFLVVLWTVFQLTFSLGQYPSAWLENGFTFLGKLLSSVLPDGILQSLIVDCIIGGVGGVFSFVPNIVILFFLLSILEDVGYMSRAVFASDRLMHFFGLHGQSTFPMLLGFGCSVPAIMAARTLKSPRDRIITILIIPFMSCGAKLPVHVLLAAAFFPNNAANMVMLIYAMGIILALFSAFVLKKTVLRGEPASFIMELPPYRAPTIKGALWHMWEKTWQYIRKAGTVILASSILIWIVTYFPIYKTDSAEIDILHASIVAEYPSEDSAAIETRVETALSGTQLVNSYAGRFGRFIEPVFQPLGFDWRIVLATITGFAAKELTVSTMGILFKAEGGSLREALANDSEVTPLIAFVLMVFILIIPPCFAALAAIKSEIGWKWLGFEVVTLLAFGWVVCFAIYQIGTLAGLGILR
jgi:ferrous iron transport protein B